MGLNNKTIVSPTDELLKKLIPLLERKETKKICYANVQLDENRKAKLDKLQLLYAADTDIKLSKSGTIAIIIDLAFKLRCEEEEQTPKPSKTTTTEKKEVGKLRPPIEVPEALMEELKTFARGTEWIKSDELRKFNDKCYKDKVVALAMQDLGFLPVKKQPDSLIHKT